MTETVIGDLTNLILEAGTTPSLWEELLPTFSRAFPGLKSTIHFEDPGGSPHRTAYVDGIDRQAVETYAAHFGALNPWNPFWATTAPFHAHVSDEVAPAEKYRNTEFYSDWLRPLGEADSAVGMKILTGEAGFGAMSLHFSPRLAGQYNRSLGHVVQSVSGYMRNALALNRRLLTNAHIPKPLEVVIVAFDEPTFLLDRSGRIRIENTAAVALLRQGTVVRQDRSGRLEFKDRSAARMLSDALGAAGPLDLQRGGKTPDTFVLRSEAGEVDGFAKVLVVSGAGGAGASTAYMFPPSRFALVTVYPKTPRQGSVESLKSVFRLTAAEARLADRLRHGEALSEIADATKVSRETLRQHLKSIFLKTGTNRQAELVLLLSRLP